MIRTLVPIAALLWLTPSLGSAQGCVDNTGCAAGTVCLSGACVQQGAPPPEASPPPAYEAAPPPTGVIDVPLEQTGHTPVPQVQESPNLGLIISGAVILGVTWILDIIVSAFAGINIFGSPDTRDWDPFRFSAIIPVVGPWIQMAVKPGSLDDDGWAYWLVADGVLQGIGLGMLIIGILTPERRTTYVDRGSGVRLAFVPGPTGASLFGSF